MTVSNTISLSPSQEFTAVGGGWQVCSSVTIREFSATAYFFGREIARTQQVPVGLICAHWGGTNIESWISAQALGEVPDFVEQLKLIRRLGNKDCDLQAEEEQRQAKTHDEYVDILVYAINYLLDDSYVELSEEDEDNILSALGG